MRGPRPTRRELVKYLAEVVQREGPLSKERQEEVILEAFENLRRRRRSSYVGRVYH